jgi:hypothetical protein
MYQLTLDVTHAYRGYWDDGGRCRVRIYQHAGEAPRPWAELLPAHLAEHLRDVPAGAPVVLVTELPDNQNTSITNMAEYLAAEVQAAYLRQPGAPMVWVEHYSKAARRGYHWGRYATLDLTTFASYQPQECWTFGRRQRIGTPDWRRIFPEQLAAVLGAEAVAAVLGEPDVAEVGA